MLFQSEQDLKKNLEKIQTLAQNNDPKGSSCLLHKIKK